MMMRIFVLVILQIVLFGIGYLFKSYFDYDILYIVLLIIVCCYAILVSDYLEKIAFIKNFVAKGNPKDNKNSQFIMTLIILFNMVGIFYGVGKLHKYQLQKIHIVTTAKIESNARSSGNKRKCIYTYVVNHEKYEKQIYYSKEETIPNLIQVAYYPSNPNIRCLLDEIE